MLFVFLFVNNFVSDCIGKMISKH